MNPIEQAFEHMTSVLEQHLALSIAFKKDLRDAVQFVTYKKGTTLQHFRQIPDQLWFLHEGIVKESLLIKDRNLPWVTWFWYAKDFLFTEPGLFNKEASDASIQLITDATLLHISYSDCIRLREQHKEVSQLIKLMRGQSARLKNDHHVMISSQKVKISFDTFVKTHPQMINLAKHKDILEFLGSTDDSFRRLT